MTRFAESPVPFLLIGLAVESILLIVYLQTRRVSFLAAMVLFVLLTVAGLTFEQVVVTDQEAVEAAVYDLAASVEANDIPAVLGHISPAAQQARQDAERELNRYEIELARIVGPLEIEFFRDSSPATARMRLKAFFKVKEGRSGIEGGGRLEFILTFAQEGDRWLLLGYAYEIEQ
jgi:hypothetical protein